MKASIVIFIVLFALSVESASHKKHKAMKSSDVSEGNEWPQPDVIRGFEVPQEFTVTPPSIDENEDVTSASNGKRHGKSSHKSHS